MWINQAMHYPIIFTGPIHPQGEEIIQQMYRRGLESWGLAECSCNPGNSPFSRQYSLLQWFFLLSVEWIHLEDFSKYKCSDSVLRIQIQYLWGRTEVLVLSSPTGDANERAGGKPLELLFKFRNLIHMYLNPDFDNSLAVWPWKFTWSLSPDCLIYKMGMIKKGILIVSCHTRIN